MTALLNVDRLRVEFAGRRTLPFAPRPAPTVAVKDVSFEIERGETLALVGESGSGKSTIGNAILGLIPTASGSVRFQDEDITRVSARRRRTLARRIQVIFQNPYGSLNPSRRVGDALAEPLYAAGSLTRGQSRVKVAELLHRVGMPADAADRFPGNFSGGQRQRIAIARALAVDPELIVCDEPTSALDVSTQRVVLELLTELQQESGLSYLFITHDLAVVRRFADRVIVLQKGRLIEEGAASTVCDTPANPYTRRLVHAAPVPDPVRQADRRARRLAAAALSRPSSIAGEHQ